MSEAMRASIVSRQHVAPTRVQARPGFERSPARGPAPAMRDSAAVPGCCARHDFSQIRLTPQTGAAAMLRRSPATADEEPEIELDERNETPEEEREDELQTRLEVGNSSDRYEEEASRAADRVIGEGTAAPVVGPMTQSSASLRRQPGFDEESEPQSEAIQPAEEGEEREDEEGTGEPIQARSLAARLAPVTPALRAQIKHANGEGQALPAERRYFYESRFGHDFSSVRIHAGPLSARASRTLKAQAFTRGQDVYFGAGYYQPETSRGRWLIAHELAHTVQQRGGDSRGHAGTIQRQTEAEAGVAGTAASRAAQRAEFAAATSSPLGVVGPLFQEAVAGFFERLAKEGIVKLVKIGKNAADAMNSPEYALAFLKGFLKGFFIDGLLGPFILLYDIGRLAVGFVKWQAGLAYRLATGDAREIAEMLRRLDGLGTWIVTNGPKLWEQLISHVGVGGVSGVVGDLLATLFARAKGLARRAGAAVADKLIEFFSKDVKQIGAVLGDLVGRIAGSVAFDVVLTAVTAGGGAAIAAGKATLAKILRLLETGAHAAVSVLETVGGWIATGYRVVAGWLNALRETRIFRALGQKLEEVFEALRALVGRLLKAVEGAGGVATQAERQVAKGRPHGPLRGLPSEPHPRLTPPRRPELKAVRGEGRGAPHEPLPPAEQARPAVAAAAPRSVGGALGPSIAARYSAVLERRPDLLRRLRKIEERAANPRLARQASRQFADLEREIVEAGMEEIIRLMPTRVKDVPGLRAHLRSHPEAMEEFLRTRASRLAEELRAPTAAKLDVPTGTTIPRAPRQPTPMPRRAAGTRVRPGRQPTQLRFNRVTASGPRPHWSRSEAAVERFLRGGDWLRQPYFRDARGTHHAITQGSIPELYSRSLHVAAEVKNYDLLREYERLASVLREQAATRALVIPHRGGRPAAQWLFLDVRGQTIGDLMAVARRIQQDTGLFEHIHFITGRGTFRAL